MSRQEFRKRFAATGPVVLPVIHVLDTPRTLTNIEALLGEGAPGCFLINHDFGIEPFLDIIRAVRSAHPSLWMGVNFLAVTGLSAFPQLAALADEGCRVDAYWADDARIDERASNQIEAAAIQAARSGWDGLYFGGTAFKKQRPVEPDDYATSARLARDWMDVVTTSGQATGIAAETDKISTFRQAIGDAPLAIASGITPDNVARYSDADCLMVATGINHEGNFYDIDPKRLRQLMAATNEMEI